MTAMQKFEFAILTVLLAVFIFLNIYLLIKSKNEKQHLLKRIKILEDAVDYDYLTGVHTRFSFVNKVNDMLTTNPCGILLIFDIDNFKMINDTCGHIEGDKLLSRFGDRLKKGFDSRALIGRLGGDEFMIFISGNIKKDYVDDMIEKSGILSFNDIQTKVKIAVSCGAAYAPQGGLTFEELYQKADKALYASKNKADSVVYYGFVNKNFT